MSDQDDHRCSYDATSLPAEFHITNSFIHVVDLGATAEAAKVQPKNV